MQEAPHEEPQIRPLLLMQRVLVMLPLVMLLLMALVLVMPMALVMLLALLMVLLLALPSVPERRAQPAPRPASPAHHERYVAS